MLKLDKQLFLLINGAHTPWLDAVMTFVTSAYTWIPFYVLLFVYIIIRKEYNLGNPFKKRYGSRSDVIVAGGWKIAVFILAATLLTFLLTDQISAGVIKPLVHRLRPSHDPATENIARFITGRGGMYGFVSNHAANFFGLAAITTLFIRKKWYTWLIFSIAILVSYSRIYVGKHFPGDVICGAILGYAIGLGIYFLARKIYLKH
ncbi:MAG: phosphatase PAP2 family protein [Bacteroidales bacterium]|nr:phosphatase PAP2 family protein [Bacteroidales bacterium]